MRDGTAPPGAPPRKRDQSSTEVGLCQCATRFLQLLVTQLPETTWTEAMT